ncbi:MAG: hypothetical protein N4A45_03305 [Flavobacteriales bacterium]|jgi:hypothetical protein|nr:hypothetical protein [Flavobacteriales bacterium]
MKSFEFMYKIGDGTPLRFKGTMALNKPFLRLTREGVNKLKKRILKRFYRKIEIPQIRKKHQKEKPKFPLN